MTATFESSETRMRCSSLHIEHKETRLLQSTFCNAHPHLTTPSTTRDKCSARRP